MFRTTNALYAPLRLALPYFRSEERWSARALLGGVVGLQLGQVALTVALNQWNNTFYNALQDRDWSVFAHQLVIFAGLASAAIVSQVYQLYLSQWLQIRWRRWMSERYLRAWLSEGTHYRIHGQGHRADNPDQRIADDVQLFISQTLSIGVDLLGSLVTLISFGIILWGLSASVPLSLFGTSFVIPGYLVWGAFLYAAAGTWIAHVIGWPLVRLNFDQQRYEADFRFALVRLRENTEEVALLGGETAETERLSVRLGSIVSNWFQIMSRQKRLVFFTAGYSQAAVVFPFIVVSPLYFSGALQLGGLMQTASAFGQVQSSFSFLVTAYTTLAEWRAVIERLLGFEAAIAAAQAVARAPGGVKRREGEGPALSVDDLVITLPDGTAVGEVPPIQLSPGERLLIMAPSGSGKSSLTRMLAGLWRTGRGVITVPAGTRLLVLPQRTYLPLGTLRGVLAYPSSETHFSEVEVAATLTECGLGRFVECLDEVADWSRRLSGGEQQRVGFARALLHRPDWLILDEATSALDEAAETSLYGLLAERLPGTGVISMGHRPSLIRLHDRLISFAGETRDRAQHSTAFSGREPVMDGRKQPDARGTTQGPDSPHRDVGRSATVVGPA
jgi:putative ATP-binding cassette transporter